MCTEALRAVDLNNPKRYAKHLEGSFDEETMPRVLEALGGIFGI